MIAAKGTVAIIPTLDAGLVMSRKALIFSGMKVLS
jgi:hypothetical protein